MTGDVKLSFHSKLLGKLQFSSLQISHSLVSDSLRPHEIAACQASLSITNSLGSLRLMSIESLMPCSQSHPLFSLSPPSLVQLLKRYSQSHSTVYIINPNNKIVCSFLDKYIFPAEKECVSLHINGYSPFHYLNTGIVRSKIKKNSLGISWPSVVRIHVFSVMGLASILIRDLKSHKPHCAAKI